MLSYLADLVIHPLALPSPQEGFNLVRNWLETLGIWAIPAFILLYIVATLVGLPVAILFIVAGTLFNFLKGAIVVSFADLISAAICFAIGRTIGRDWVRQWVQKRPLFAKLDRAVAREGWKIVLVTRLSPIVPSNVLNYGFSLTKVKFREYLLFSWLGMIPVVCLYVYLGSIGANLLDSGSPTQWRVQILGLGVTVAAIAFTTWWAKRTLDRADKPEEEPSNS